MNHLSGDQIIRLAFSESQEYVDDYDELSLTAFPAAKLGNAPPVEMCESGS
jgi:hypothetical protein